MQLTHNSINREILLLLYKVCFITILRCNFKLREDNNFEDYFLYLFNHSLFPVFYFFLFQEAFFFIISFFMGIFSSYNYIFAAHFDPIISRFQDLNIYPL